LTRLEDSCIMFESLEILYLSFNLIYCRTISFVVVRCWVLWYGVCCWGGCALGKVV